MRVVLFANTDWYLYNFRLSLATALRDAGHDLYLLSPYGRYGERLRELGFNWHPVPMSRASLNPLREALLLIWLFRWMRQVRPDVVHSFTIKCAVYGSLVARAIGSKRINAVAGLGFVFTNNALKAKLLRVPVKLLLRLALSGRSARLILQNRDDVRLFTESGIVSPALIRLIPGSGVDCSKFCPAPHRASSSGSIRVLLASRLLWDKGVAEYVGAARLLGGRTDGVEFLLAGMPDEGNPASIPKEDVTHWHSAGLVQWLGHADDMASLLKTVDIVVLPSYREGLPKSLIEAAACARALVTTDVPGCREVVTHGKDGLLVNVRSVEDLVGAIETLANNASLRLRLGESARRKAISTFSEDIVISDTLKTYDELFAASAKHQF